MNTLEQHSHTSIAESTVAKIQVIASSHRNLEEITRWVFSQQQPIQLLDMLTQDEFSIDVVIRYDDDRYLVYGVT